MSICQPTNTQKKSGELFTFTFYYEFFFPSKKAFNSSIFPLSRSTYMRTATQSPYYIDDAFIDLIIKPTHFTITQDRCSSNSSHYFSSSIMFCLSFSCASSYSQQTAENNTKFTLPMIFLRLAKKTYFLFSYELEIVTNS